MGNILQMKFLQIRKQKMLHILPLLFFSSAIQGAGSDWGG